MEKFPPANAHVHDLADQVLLGLELLPVEDPAPALPLLTSSAERETGTPGNRIVGSEIIVLQGKPSRRRGGEYRRS